MILKTSLGTSRTMNLLKIEKPSTQLYEALKSSEKRPKNLPDQIKEEHKDLPWKRMVGMRDKLIHDYFGVDTKTLYKTAKEDIPPLKTLIQVVLKEQEKQ